MFGELGRFDHQQGFIVGVGSGGAPVEAACDHGFVVDHSDHVIDNLEIPVVMGGLGAAEGE